MTEQHIDRPAVVVITGTHSSGKSTLLSDIEVGKLSTLGIYDDGYNDLGYGFLETDNGTQPYITVPESARRLADAYHRPDLLTDHYDLDFQLEIDFQALCRINTATHAADELPRALLDEGLIESSQPVITPIIIPDRGPLDGIVYSKLQLPGENVDIIRGSPRTGFWSEWLKSSVDIVVITDYKDVPFEADEARLEDARFRQKVDEAIKRSYRQFLDERSIVAISGNRIERREKLLSLLGRISNFGSIVRTMEPYAKWESVKLDILTK